MSFFWFGFRIDSGTTCCEGEPKLECCSYGMPHCLRGLLSFREGFSSNCRMTLPEIVFSISSSVTPFDLNCYVFGMMQETMSKEHAMRFPLVGSAMLLSLFLLFKFLSKDLVNAVLTAYFFVLGIVALSYAFSKPCFVWVFLVKS